MRPSLVIFCVWCLIVQACNGVADGEEEGFVVKRGNRRVLVSTENGEIQAARVGKEIDGTSYLLHFITMDPNSLFLPVILHSDMVFYVHTGSGKLSWTEESEVKTADIRRGDVYRLKAGAVFFIQSNLETETHERQKLRIYSIFPNSNTDMHGPPTGPYSSIRDMVVGFDKKVLQAAFKVREEVIEELLSGTKPPAIIHGVSRKAWEMEIEFLDSLLGSTSYNIFELKKKKGKSSPKLFNIFKEDKDLETRYGWSTTVTGKKLSALKGTNIGLFMVNLTTGSMMGPHWNPVAHEVAVVVRGRGMVRVVGSSVLNETGCGDMRFEVEEGDIFAVPRFHAMAQMAFNNETFVFVGFSSSARRNHPQFLAGQASVLRTLSKDVLARSFNVGTTTMDRLLASQQDSIMLGCISCAEEELRILEQEREKEREEAREREEERRRKEEEARQREEEEAKRREEERKRQEKEEEEARRAEEERKRQEEEEAARQREEEEAARQEEERKRREEEEEAAARKAEEEAARREEEERERREEEEAASRRAEEERKRQEEEEAARREEEERKRREEEEEEEAAATRAEEERERQEEEAAARRAEEEEAARREEEERKRREEEEEEAAATRAEEERERQEEEAAARRAEEEEAARREEEERKRQEEEEEEEAAAARRAEEEEAARREEEERQRQEEEEAAARRAEEERQRQEEEEAAARRAKEERRRREEEEAARRAEEERQRQEEEATRRAEEEKQRQREEEEEEPGEQRSEEEEAAEEERRREKEEQREEEAAARQPQEEDESGREE